MSATRASLCQLPRYRERHGEVQLVADELEGARDSRFAHGAKTLKHLDFQSIKAISVREHEEIFEAIKARDPAAAATAMRAHLQNSSRRLGLVPRL
jgi:DNA-binding FadR family transcriptional regulator